MPSPCNDIIDDIEDLISSQDITPKERYSTKRKVTVRVKRKHDQDAIPEPQIYSSIIPGKYNYIYFLIAYILFPNSSMPDLLKS